jgi:hypothetical protein
LPFLSEGLPLGIAMKGLQKISPKLASYLKRGQKLGLDVEEGMRFIKDKLQPQDLSESQTQQPEKAKAQARPQSLFRRLVGDIDFSQLDERTTKEISFFEKIASQLEKKGKDEKDPAVKNLKKKIDKALKGMTGMIESEAMQMEPQQEIEQQPIQGQPIPGQTQIQEQQPEQGQQALMAILQKIQASRGL